ncbi:hypothetical protein [Streptomyces tritici]|uniref:hypothetical protein n=1 Tax=Streptomyces tritici TaxID=2054410 RepID=UPI003AF1CE26
MTWIYCEEWNELTERPMGPLTVAEAQARHVGGELYTAILYTEDEPHPELRVEVRWETDYAAVIFMDELARDALDYTFSVIDGSLFLEEVTIYDYGDAKERGGYASAERVETYTFAPDGVGTRTVDVDDEVTEESRDGLDVSLHWEPVPEFGAYDSLIRRDRDRPWGAVRRSGG